VIDSHCFVLRTKGVQAEILSEYAFAAKRQIVRFKRNEHFQRFPKLPEFMSKSVRKCFDTEGGIKHLFAYKFAPSPN
jgi:hypothetical protein